MRELRNKSLARLTGASAADVSAMCREAENDREFIADVRSRYRRHTNYFPLPTDFMVAENGNTMFFSCVALYALCRLIQPRKIIETGGTPGKSSAFILRALRRNAAGHLWTIDLAPPPAPAGDLSPSEGHSFTPHGLTSGWAIPDALLDRHSVVAGDARVELPPLLESLGEIDIFIHDSDHSYEHMMWEFKAAYPYVRAGGIMWSDDILGHSAWLDFCRDHGIERCDFTSQGAASIERSRPQR
ncbi:MAG: class I SAM-dependent methyltransferase [Candidatus Binataceae bacterium]